MKYLLDTDHITIYQLPQAPEHAILTTRMAQHSSSDFAFSIISFHEQLLGAQAYVNRARTSAKVVRGYLIVEQVRANYASAQVLLFDTPAAAVFDNLHAQRVRVGTMDLRIASIALSQNLTLLTRNTVDFQRVPGLLIEDWTV